MKPQQMFRIACAIAVIAGGAAACASTPTASTMADAGQRKRVGPVIKDPFEALQNPAVGFTPKPGRF